MGDEVCDYAHILKPVLIGSWTPAVLLLIVRAASFVNECSLSCVLLLLLVLDHFAFNAQLQAPRR